MLALLALLMACAARHIALKSLTRAPPERAREFCRQVEKLARAGDWLVVRGVHSTDDLVAGFTRAYLKIGRGRARGAGLAGQDGRPK